MIIAVVPIEKSKENASQSTRTAFFDTNYQIQHSLSHHLLQDLFDPLE